MVGERMVVTFKPGRVVEEWVASEYHGASSALLRQTLAT